MTVEELVAELERRKNFELCQRYLTDLLKAKACLKQIIESGAPEPLSGGLSVEVSPSMGLEGEDGEETDMGMEGEGGVRETDMKMEDGGGDGEEDDMGMEDGAGREDNPLCVSDSDCESASYDDFPAGTRFFKKRPQKGDGNCLGRSLGEASDVHYNVLRQKAADLLKAEKSGQEAEGRGVGYWEANAVNNG